MMPCTDQRFEYGGECLPIYLAIGSERRDCRGIDAFEFQDDFSIDAAGTSTSASAFIPSGAMNISMFSRDSSQCSKTRSTTVFSSWELMAAMKPSWCSSSG
jgi:hypothetical protein